MKLIDKVKEKKILSLEILPPNRGDNAEQIFKVVDELIDFPIDFISVTRHPPLFSYIESDSKIIKAKIIERPGSFGITAALKNRYKIDVIPHIVSFGMNKLEIEDLLIDLNLLGIENLFIVRGDADRKVFIDKEAETNYHKNAATLVLQIKNMNNGEYLFAKQKKEPTNFCIGVAGYPEKHYESPNIFEDLLHLKEKLDNGADFIITQMVFDINLFKSFLDKLKKFKINVPVIAGIKPIVSLNSLYNIPKKFFVNIPQSFLKKMQEAKSKEQEFKIGTNYISNLIEKIYQLDVNGIHIFTMGKGNSTKAVLEKLYYGG